jgi:hypothetical protein
MRDRLTLLDLLVMTGELTADLIQKALRSPREPLVRHFEKRASRGVATAAWDQDNRPRSSKSPATAVHY